MRTLAQSDDLQRVPVVTDENSLLGRLGSGDIMVYQMEHGLSQEIMADTDIVHMTKMDVAVVRLILPLAEVLHKLVDESFLCRLWTDFPRDYYAQVYPQGCQCLCMTLVRL